MKKIPYIILAITFISFLNSCGVRKKKEQQRIHDMYYAKPRSAEKTKTLQRGLQNHSEAQTLLVYRNMDSILCISPLPLGSDGFIFTKFVYKRKTSESEIIKTRKAVYTIPLGTVVLYYKHGIVKYAQAYLMK